ncbi:UNKNOWN [Stylonychia lemnae]|uniref:HMG box domain-containing protein n=1 Tax=Stylonychia lemnae TaxID=5949 RepID=A0A078BB45_STYLE|nr:UNKNOWN [Stylonychia lemnae]|eukprot:CDW90788.1 UNKNOWN [Stylonychia lemnae]
MTTLISAEILQHTNLERVSGQDHNYLSYHLRNSQSHQLQENSGQDIQINDSFPEYSPNSVEVLEAPPLDIQNDFQLPIQNTSNQTDYDQCDNYLQKQGQSLQLIDPFIQPISGFVQQQQYQNLEQTQPKLTYDLNQIQDILLKNPEFLSKIMLQCQAKEESTMLRVEQPMSFMSFNIDSQKYFHEQSSLHNMKDVRSTMSSQISSQKTDETQYVFDPNKLIYKSDIPEEEQLTNFHEQMRHSKLDKYAAKYDLCSLHPKMKKNHLCSETQEHLCDTCIITDVHKDHTTAPLSKIALEIHKQFNSHFSQFEGSLNAIERIDAKNWKVKLRQNYLRLFDDLYGSLDKIKNQKLREINNIFAQIDVKDVNQKLNEMQVSHDVALNYSSLVNGMFDQNQYSAITKRQDQFNLLGQSLNQLTVDCNGLLDLAQNKRRKLDNMQEQIQKLVSNIKYETESKLQVIVDEQISIESEIDLEKLEQQNIKESLEAKKKREARNGFYYFLKEQSPKISQAMPQMKQIEIIAYLHSKWQSLNEEQKLTYEMLSNEHEKVLENATKKTRCQSIVVDNVEMKDESEKPCKNKRKSSKTDSDAEELVSNVKSAQIFAAKADEVEKNKSILRKRKLEDRVASEIELNTYTNEGSNDEDQFCDEVNQTSKDERENKVSSNEKRGRHKKISAQEEKKKRVAQKQQLTTRGGKSSSKN